MVWPDDTLSDGREGAARVVRRAVTSLGTGSCRLGAHWDCGRWPARASWTADPALSPLDAWKAATSAAEKLGLLPISHGRDRQLADLIVLDADPLADIHNSVKIRCVIKNGQLFDGPTLASGGRQSRFEDVLQRENRGDAPIRRRDLGGTTREALRQRPSRLARRRTLGAAGLQRSLAPGKWTAAEILVHLAQVETMFQARLRLGLATPGIALQPFDQDDFMRTGGTDDGSAALEAYLGLRRFALPLIERLTAAELATPMRHADYGDISVAWLLAWCAGHERRHLGQLAALA